MKSFDASNRQSQQATAGQSAPTLIGPYQIKELLGQGGMGAVYLATHSKLKKDVALKLLPADVADQRAAARFEREMESAGKLDHPNVVRALDAGEADGHSFLVMELLRGHDVAALVSGKQSLAVADACEIARQAAVGLHYAHQNGLVHRDVKPANLMLTVDAQGQPIVKVMDLGLARLSESAPSRQLTDQGQLMGTLEFMSPEQTNDTKNVDYRADIYSLGATLYRLLTGTVPFDGENYDTPVRRLDGLSEHEAPPIEQRRGDLPNDLINLVNEMLSRDPADRPTSMAKIARQLAPLAKGHDLVGRLAEPVERHRDGAATLFQDDGNGSLFDTAPRTMRSLVDTDPAVLAGSADRSRSATPLNSKRGLVGLVALCATVAIGVAWWRTSDRQGDRVSSDPTVNAADAALADSGPTPDNPPAASVPPPVDDPAPNCASLRVMHHFVRNEGWTQTLTHSECRVIPFVTYTSLTPDDPEYQQGADQWKEILALHGEKTESGFVLPEWLNEGGRVPLPGGRVQQQTADRKVNEGNNFRWYSDPYVFICLEDDPATSDRDERLEVTFLIISRFSVRRKTVEYFEFKTLDELKYDFDENNLQLDREIGRIYTATVPRRNSRYGLPIGVANLRHYLTFDPIGRGDLK